MPLDRRPKAPAAAATLLDRLPLAIAREVEADPRLLAAAAEAAGALQAAQDKADAIVRLGATPFAAWLAGRGIDAPALALSVQMAR